jgi:hypothetical protein
VSSHKRTQTVVEGARILKTLEGATTRAAGLKGVNVGVAERPGLRRLYTEVETSVFLLKLAAKEDDAPPYDASLEKLERQELVSKMIKCLEETTELASEDLPSALRQARVARDCAAALLHSVNLEARRTKA